MAIAYVLNSAFSHIQFICQCMGKAIQGTFYNVMVLPSSADIGCFMEDARYCFFGS